MWIGFVIWSIVALIFLGIGIHSRKEKEATGILELIGIPMLLCEQNSPIFVFMILAVVALVLIMMVVYFKIEKKYKK